MTALARFLVLGCGYAGTAAAELARARGLAVLASTRSDERAAALRARGFEVEQRRELDRDIAASVDASTHVLIAFPPDGRTDARIAPALAGAGAITYLSSTGVYGEHRGAIDDTTAVASPPDERAAKILAAEEEHRRAGAIVLRCPGIYGPERGLHVRVVQGNHRIPGDGSRFLSRIHVEDLAALVLATGAPGLRRPDTFVVGDLEPAVHLDVVRFLADSYGVPPPPSVPLEDVHPTLRADRRVDPRRALETLGVTLRYPSFRQGMAPSATRLVP